MTTIFFGEYQVSKGSTEVTRFWSDVHVLDFRADAPINTRHELEVMVERFNEDKENFDWIDYSVGQTFKKARREYFTPVVRRKFLMEATFVYQGKTYKTKTSKWSKRRDIEDKADEVLKLVDLHVEALVRDDNGAILAIIKEEGRTNHFLDDMSDANDPNSYMTFE